MKFGKVYIEWVKYLKAKGLYARYMYEYAMTNEYLNARNILIDAGEYFRTGNIYRVKGLNHRFFNCKDTLIGDRGINMNFSALVTGMSNLMWYRDEVDRLSSMRGYVDWVDIIKKFGEERGYLQKPRENKRLGDSYWYSYEDLPHVSTASTTQIANNTRLTRHEEAHAGQWYDRYYNGGRNFNNRNNNRWRR